MNEPSIRTHETRLWSTAAGRGFLGVTAGLLFLSNPWLSLRGTANLFMAYALADGALSLYQATCAKRVARPRTMLLVAALFDAAAAIAVLVMPAVLPLRIAGGLRAVATGSCDALWTRRQRLSEMLTLAGVAAVLVGGLILAWPGPGTVALPWLLGLQTMISGALLVAGGVSEMQHGPSRHGVVV